MFVEEFRFQGRLVSDLFSGCGGVREMHLRQLRTRDVTVKAGRPVDSLLDQGDFK